MYMHLSPSLTYVSFLTSSMTFVLCVGLGRCVCVCGTGGGVCVCVRMLS